MCHSDFRSYKFSWATFRRHAIVPLVLFAMALHHQVKLKRKEKGLQFARSSSEEAVVKLKGCHFIHESMLYFVHFLCSFPFVKSFKVAATNIIFKSSARAIMRNRWSSYYDVHTFLKFPIWVNVKCVLKCGFIKVCVQQQRFRKCTKWDKSHSSLQD